MAAKIHVGDIGTQFIATVKDQGAVVVDISTASTKEFLFRKPDGTIVTKAASFVTSGVDGQMKYVSLANDLPVSGAWQVQGHVILASGEWHTDIHNFMVDPNLA